MWRYILSLITMVAVYFLHTSGMAGAYVQYWWLDIVSHGLVCFSIALFLSAVIHTHLSNFKYKKTFIIVTTFIIGVMWEWLEVEYNITGYTLWSEPYIQDTLKDFAVDAVGAFIGAFIGTYKS
jgi:hypothetical protein